MDLIWEVLQPCWLSYLGPRTTPGERKVNLNQGMAEVLKQLNQYPIKTRLSLTGTLVVARDIAHAKLKEALDRGDGLPQYLKDHPVYYAGPAKTPE
ncbi:fumarate hydratase class I, partial [Elysia marginata]